MPRETAAHLVRTAIFAILSTQMMADVLPSGTYFEARFSAPTGSRISHPGDRIEAIVIAPVFGDGRLLIPPGTVVSGVIGKVQRLGLGLKHLTSSIEYRFDRLRLPDGKAISIAAQMAQVETAKERVDDGGNVTGIYPTANVSSSIAFYAVPALWADPEVGLPVLAIKCVIARSPDPEIYFPAGTEFILRLTAKADVPASGSPALCIAPLSEWEIANAQQLLANLPYQRTHGGGNRPSDLVNILFLGGREPINRAFRAAGWDVAQSKSLRSTYRMYHSMVQRIGYSAAPMGRLTLNGFKADLDYQKGLNTFSKRHHIRLWKQGQDDAWLAAATEDVSYRVRRMHLTHATDPLIDNERAKVLNDLALTGCLDAAALITRKSSVEPDQRELSLETDQKLAVVRVNDCLQPTIIVKEPSSSGRYGRSRSIQALVALRNDLIRSNPVSLAYNTVGALRQNRKFRTDRSLSASGAKRRNANSPENMQPRWIRPSVLDSMTTMNTALPQTRAIINQTEYP